MQEIKGDLRKVETTLEGVAKKVDALQNRPNSADDEALVSFFEQMSEFFGASRDALQQQVRTRLVPFVILVHHNLLSGFSLAVHLCSLTTHSPDLSGMRVLTGADGCVRCVAGAL